MYVLVKVTHDENLFIVSNRLASEELFRLFKGSFVLAYLVVLGIKGEAVGDPAIIPTKDKDFILVDSETADRVTR
jgi:RNA-binding protein YlmH